MPRHISLQQVPQRLLLLRADGMAAITADLEAMLYRAMTARTFREYAETVFCRYVHDRILFESFY